MAQQQQTDSTFLKSPPPQAGKWMRLPHVSFLKTVEVYIRECYELLYMDIQDYFALGQRFIHISGNPGTGKSCFLWYVLARILNDPAERSNAVILQLVEDENRRTFEILPGGDKLKRIDHPEASSYYTRPGTWLLTDQKFVGYATARTVLFEDDNWGKAVRLLDERKFALLFMPPWSLEELKIFFFRDKARTRPAINEFWVRFYLSGSIVRCYAFPLESVYLQLVTRVTKVVSSERSVNATLFRGAGVDKGEFSHHVFCSWPSLDFTRVKSYSFVSAFVADCFATACFRGDLQNWSTELLKLAADPDLRSAAGVLFERYAHYSLSRGGFFPSVDDSKIGLELRARPVKYFSGKTFPLEKRYLDVYLRPTSSSFPWFDSGYLPNVLMQISMAKTRKPIPKSIYEAQVSKLKQLWTLHPDAPSGLRGVPGKEVYTVLVKLQGDDHTAVPKGLEVWEEAPEEKGDGNTSENENDEGNSSRRKRRRTRMSRRPLGTNNGQTATVVAKAKRKVTTIPFQMTIALKQEDGLNINYEPLHVLYGHVRKTIVYERDDAARVVDGTDTAAEEFGNTDSEEDLRQIQVLMRQGKGSAYYEEIEDDNGPVFTASINASRSDGVEETTVVTIDCIAGQLDESRGLRIFIDERRGREIRFDDPFMIPMNLRTALDDITGDEYEVTLDATKVTVKIVCKGDRCRMSKYFGICSLTERGGAEPGEGCS